LIVAAVVVDAVVAIFALVHFVIVFGSSSLCLVHLRCCQRRQQSKHVCVLGALLLLLFLLLMVV
jgi:hypothetical protein